MKSPRSLFTRKTTAAAHRISFPGLPQRPGAFEMVQGHYIQLSKCGRGYMVEKGYNRKVVLPAGTWKGDKSVTRESATVEIKVPVDRLPVFELIQK